MAKATDTLARFFLDRSPDAAFSVNDFTNSVWSGTQEQLEELVRSDLIERPLGDKYVLTPSGRSMIGAHWGGR